MLRRCTHYDGCYRYTMAGRAWFAQVKRDDTLRRHPRKWAVEIRDRHTGDVVRHGGQWPTLRDAVAELEWLLEKEAPPLQVAG